MKIDVHCHAWPQEYLQAFKECYSDAIEFREDPQGKLPFGFPGARLFLPVWDHDQRLLEMDKARVDVGVLSAPTAYDRVDEHSPRLCRILNDALAESCKRNPDRFKAYAHIPFSSMEVALGELSRAIAEPGFVGVVIGSNIGGRYPHTPDFLPFWEEVNRRRIPVFMHPNDPPNYQDDEMPQLLAYPFETTLSATKLLYSGLYERFPDIILILSHLGGALPYLARRIDMGFELPSSSPKYKQLPRPPSDYLNKLYLDTAIARHRPAFECAKELVGIDHIVYGTDQFFPGTRFMDLTNEFLEGLGVSPVDREKIYSKNAERILNLS